MDQEADIDHVTDAPYSQERGDMVKLLERVRENISDAVSFGPAFALRHLSYLAGKPVHGATVDGFRIYLRRNSKDAVIFRQIFRKSEWDFNRFPQAARVQECYETIVRRGERPVIIDAGANVGAASLWLARRFPFASIVAVEPDPDNARMCRLNTTDAKNVSVVEAAIGSSPGAVNLSNPAGSSVAFQSRRSATGAVPVRTVDELAKGGRLFIVKIDIEGFEADLFSLNTDWLDRVSMVMIELHDWMLPEKFSSRSLQRAMAERPFELLVFGENLFYVR